MAILLNLGKSLPVYGTRKSDSRYSDSTIWTFFPINFPESTKTQRNKNIMRKRSTVLTHIFLYLHSKQRFKCSLLSKTYFGGIVFGEFNQI